jgi:hypothetical protein
MVTMRMKIVAAPAALGLAVLVGGALVDAVASTGPGSVAAWSQSDLDEFMRGVLAKRDENWKKLQQYVLDERERLDLTGPSEVRILGFRREYRWYVRDGFFVRSPTVFDGVTVPESDRRKYEDDYLRRAREREKRVADSGGSADGDPDIRPIDNPPATQATMNGLVSQTRQPEFVNTAYFLRFKFEEGKYALVGRETFDGRQVLRIEYYPARLFSRNADRAAKADGKPSPTRQQDVAIERLMNKNSLVTLWVEPEAKQIVKYVFDNIQTEFLAVSWLMRVEDLKASMTMSQPFKDVWLPRDVEMYFRLMSALGTVDARYQLDYHDYTEAKTSGRIIGGGGGR